MSVDCKLNVTASPALIVVEKLVPPLNGGVITGLLFAPAHAITTNCISLSTSAMRAPYRKLRTSTLMAKLPDSVDVKVNSPVMGSICAGMLPALMVPEGVGEEEEKPVSKGTGIGLDGGL